MGWGQNFTQVTTIGQLTSGEYLIIGDSTSDGIMLNSTLSGPIITYTAITNPGSTISSGFTSDNVFVVTVTGTDITIYNSTVGYVSWGNTGTGTSNNAGFYNGSPTNNEVWTASVASSLWTLANKSTSARLLQWNSGSPRFAAYTTAQTKLKLYKKDGITVTFNKNAVDATGTMANQTASTATNLTSNSYTRTGYTFSNWNTLADGSGTSYANNESFPFSANATLYAQWTAITTPTITKTGSLSALTTTYGTASSTSTFSVSGTALTDDILVTPPAGFEVSTNSSSAFGSSVTLNQTAGVVSSIPIYIRLAATTNAGSYSGNVVLTSAGATDVNVATISSTVNTKALTISGLTANPKEYDNTTSVVVSGTPAYTGLVNSESFSVSGVVSYAFASATAATPQTITRTGTYETPSANYTVTQPTFTANITKKALTITSATVSNKNYDGTNSATLSGTLDGVISPDVITLNLSATFNNATVGTSKPVTSTSTISSTTNYSLIQPTGLTADIIAVVPNAPVISAITATSQQLSVAFTAPANDGGSAISNYAYSIDNGTTFTALSPIQTSSPIVITGLINGTTYPVVIYAINSVGNGALSTAVNGTPSIQPITLATWNFTTNISPTGIPSNLSISNLIQGNNNGTTTILDSTSASTGYTGASGTNNAGAAARTGALAIGNNGSAYFEFTITPTTGYYFSLSDISFGSRGTSTSPIKYSLRSSVDSYVSDIATGSLTANSTWALYSNSSINSVSSAGSPITYRIYGYNGAGSPSVNTANWRIDDLILKGHVIEVPTNNWIGDGGNWNVAGNWSLSQVPSTNENVTILSGNPIIDTNVTIGAGKSLTISGTSTTLSIAPGKVLTIAGTADFGGKLVTFKSDNTGSAMLGTVTGSLTGATNVKVERYIPQGKRAFRFLAPGVTTTNFIENNWQEATHITGSTTGANGFDQTGSGSPSMYTYNNQASSGTGWTAISSTDATNLEAEKGYRLLVRGDRTSTILTAPAEDDMNAAITLAATGTLKTGNVTINASSTPVATNGTSNATTNGFSFVGNPYVSAVDWNSVTKTNLEDTYYVWDTNVGTTAQRGRYVSFSEATGVNNYGNTGVSATNRYIQAGQAFFVKNTTLGTAGSLTFSESSKATSSPFVFRTDNQNAMLSVLLYASTELALGGYPIDGITSVFGTNFDNQVGYGDVSKLESAGENIAWYTQSNKLDINAQAPAVATDVLMIKSLRLGANKNYTFRIKTTNFDTSLTGYLVDNYLNTQQEIDMTQDFFTTFATSNEALSYGEDRFKIVFSTSLDKDQFDSKGITIYPNPVVDNQFSIQLPTSISGKVVVKIFTALGQEVYQSQSDATPTMIVNPKQTLATGVYVVSITCEGKEYKQKIMVK